MANAWSPNENQQCNHSSHANLIDLILSIPELVLKHHNRKNLVDVVLCQLAGHNGFGLEKAAYFVQNKDFNVTKGVCGYAKEYCYNFSPVNQHLEIIDQDFFDNVDYCRNIKTFRADCLLDKLKEQQSFQQLISMENPRFASWDTKNDNQGTLIFQVNNPSCCLLKDAWFSNALRLLCLC